MDAPENLQSNQQEILDMTDMHYDEALAYFQELVNSGIAVLHGTNAQDPYPTLEPRQANDLAGRESGNKVAVYATTIPEFAMQHAIYNKKYLDEVTGGSYITGHGRTDGVITFKVSPNVYKLHLDNDPEIFSDGYVYVLNRDDFKKSEGTSNEFHTESSALPLQICKISRKIGPDLFKDRLTPYSGERMEELK